jgi:hypothetical protein
VGPSVEGACRDMAAAAEVNASLGAAVAPSGLPPRHRAGATALVPGGRPGRAGPVDAAGEL